VVNKSGGQSAVCTVFPRFLTPTDIKRYAHLHDAHVADGVSAMVAANMAGVSYAGPVEAKRKAPGEVIALSGRRKDARQHRKNLDLPRRRDD